MTESAAANINTIVAKDTWTSEDHAELLQELVTLSDAPGKFRAIAASLEADAPEPTGAAAVKIGIARYMLCRFPDAIDALGAGTDNKDRRYFQALCLKELRRYEQAAEEFERARERGWDAKEIDVHLAEIAALSGDLEAADKRVAKLQKSLGESATWFYLRGMVDEFLGRDDDALDAYEQAREIDPAHPQATFRLAFFHDLHGDEEQAGDLYRECISQAPTHANALLNLSVLYEDAGQYEQAVACIRRVLAANPAHPRARHFLRDCESSKSMYFDEDKAKRLARRNALLDTPVTDFELSVRARNCLKKMEIRTLGDLVRTTEVKLMAYKNFGETSLKEIREMLSAKGLRLGQALEEGSELADMMSATPVGVKNEGVLATPLEQIEFSIRVRRALTTLKLATLGELAAKTEPELLGCGNFGQTSLNEVRQRLAEYGLTPREPD
jgi:DNA-directed RNA polymerase subunit alpha